MVENQQSNGPIERFHKVIHNIIVTKDIKNISFDYIGPWGNILTSVAWAIRALYHSTFYTLPAQLVFVKRHYLQPNISYLLAYDTL